MTAIGMIGIGVGLGLIFMLLLNVVYMHLMIRNAPTIVDKLHNADSGVKPATPCIKRKNRIILKRSTMKKRHGLMVKSL